MSYDVFLEHACERNKSYLWDATLVTAIYGNLGCMKPPEELADRLEIVLKAARRDQKDVIRELVKLTGLTRQGVTKWFDGGSDMKMVNLFQVADFLGVDPRWLATGKGEMKPDKSSACAHTDIPDRRIALIRLYSTLPDADRMAARRFIETLSWSAHPRKDEYVAEIAKVSITPSRSSVHGKPSSGHKLRPQKPQSNRTS